MAEKNYPVGWAAVAGNDSPGASNISGQHTMMGGRAGRASLTTQRRAPQGVRPPIQSRGAIGPPPGTAAPHRVQQNGNLAAAANPAPADTVAVIPIGVSPVTKQFSDLLNLTEM
jgi:hypothetical protein